jgi:hypothetical protein
MEAIVLVLEMGEAKNSGIKSGTPLGVVIRV